MNRLAKEKAAYLKHSAHQKIDWYPWSEEAFGRAKKEDKPVFLSSGAIWCHWCHVMAKECFEDEEVIRLLNDNCINIKLDRDEKPDIDRIYQQAVAAMGSGGGWPLSVFLTPGKKPFFGGTYFPPDDRYGRPGFKKVVRTVVEFYHTKKDEIEEYTMKLAEFLKPGPTVPCEIEESLIDEALAAISDEFDPQNGGFGRAPKFPMPGAMEFLINQFFKSPKESIGLAIRKTLLSMAKGGFHDHLGGGFHRYSVDNSWIIPHFEKMADDNAWLLRNYTDAYCLFGDPYFSEVAQGIVRFSREVLSDPEGGFYASQDADVTPNDEGGYFTWTEEDFGAALNEEEYRVLSLHLFHDKGSMHHDPSKKVLFVSMEPDEIGKKLGMETEKVREIIARGKKSLLRRRYDRESPYVDKAFYTSLNGLFISSYLRAYRAFGDGFLRDFALKSLRRISEIHLKDSGLLHIEKVNGLLFDYVHLADAFIAAYEITADRMHSEKADRLMEQCIGKFWDNEGGGFFDSEDEVIGVRLKGVEDIPHPSANAQAIINMLRLNLITGKEEYMHYAERALKSLVFRARDMGIHAGYYFCALDAYFNLIRLNMEAAPESALAETALSTFNPYAVIAYGEEKGYVTPCRRGSCFESIFTPDGLREFLKKAKHW